MDSKTTESQEYDLATYGVILSYWQGLSFYSILILLPLLESVLRIEMKAPRPSFEKKESDILASDSQKYFS